MSSHVDTVGRTQLLQRIERLESRRLLDATIYVDVNSPGPVHDGASWASAFVDVQEALAVATASDQVRVAEGIYKPTAGNDRTATINLKNGVSLIGGYAGFGAADPDDRNIEANLTILSGDIGAPGSSLDNTLHVVTATNVDSSAVLDGFTITAGNADTTSLTANGNLGGGMLNVSASPTTRSCTFRENYGFRGGAINNQASSPILIDCVLTRNTGGASGGGMAGDGASAPVLTRCTISYSTIIYYEGGGGISSGGAILTNCIFEGNNANTGGVIQAWGALSINNCTFNNNSAGWGGAIHNGRGTSASINGCTFTGNSAGLGGAIYNLNSSATFQRCTFLRNDADEGGAMYNKDCTSLTSTLIDCTLGSNTADRGGAIYEKSSRFTARGCTFNDNQALGEGGAIGGFLAGAVLTGCTFTGNSAGTGGAIGASQFTHTAVIDCLFTGNSASADGGAVGGYFQTRFTRSSPSSTAPSPATPPRETAGDCTCTFPTPT
jgi:hypothetical protein